MNDDAGRSHGQLRGLHRGTGEQEHVRGWFAEEPGTGIDAGADAPPAEQLPADEEPAAQQSPEERYAEAVAVMNRIVSTRDFRDLPRVRDVFRVTADSMHDQDPARAGVFNNLGSAWQLTYLSTGDGAALEDAVSHYRAASRIAREDDPDLVLYTCNLALALTDKASGGGDGAAAAEAADTARAAVEQLSDRDQRRVVPLMRLGNALKLHARIADEPASDDEAIAAFRDAMRSPGIGATIPTSEVLIDLGTALLRRYERAAATEDLDEGIAHLRTGIDGLGDGDPRRLALCRLANALRLRFQRNGDLNDLDVAINELHGVLGVLAPGHALLGRSLWNLACATAEHVDSTGEPSQLRQVLQVLPTALRDLAGDDADRTMALASYGGLLRRQFLHGAAPQVLDTAVAAGDAAVEAAGSAQRRCVVMNSLTTTLITRYEHGGATADLDRSAELAERAAELAPEHSPPQHTAWAQRGVLAAHRFRLNAKSSELETSIELLDRAVSAMPPNAPGRAAVATQLGRSLQMLHQKTGRRRLYRWAHRVLTEAAAQHTAPADERVRAANLCGRLAASAHRWSEALDSFTTAVELLPLVTRGKRVVGSSTAHRRWAWVAADAAACAVEKGEPQRAVELLEHGHCALLGDFLPASSELGQLHEELPDLADEAVRLRRLLDRPPEEMALSYADTVDDGLREGLAHAWAELLREARTQHPGHSRTPDFGRLAAAGREGAVVLVNLSRYRSDALVVFAERVLTVPLPGADPEEARTFADNALTAARQRDARTLADALDWAWRNITNPVLSRMGYVAKPRQGRRWPRVWWSGIGPHAFLPLHAATAKTGESALDRVISSYTPSLAKLVQAQNRPQRTQDRAADGRAMVAAGSAERIARELPRQNQVLARYWPSAEIFSTEGADADAMLEAVPKHQWVHSCEPALQHPAHPAAGVVLDRQAPDRPLNLVELGQFRPRDAEFAYLDRCATAVEPPSAASVPMATALGFAGFAHVISTLWAVDRETATQVLADVYAELFGQRGAHAAGSADALHAAAQRVRAEHPDEPERWAAHVHVGP